MQTYKYFVTLLFLFIASTTPTAPQPPRTLQTSSQTITPTRSSQMTQQCSTTNRQGLYEKYGSQSQVAYSSEFEAIFSLDVQVFNEFLQLNISGINSLLQANSLGYFLYVALALTGLAIMIVAAPIMYILIFCPMQACLRKRLIYTPFEMTWPAVILFLLGVGVISTCLIGLVSNYSLYQGYQQLGCSGTIIFDDALNGNINADKTSFFAGTKTIARQMMAFENNQGAIYGNLSQLSSARPYFTNSMSLIGKSLQSIQTIPSNSGSSLPLNYQIPLRSSTTTGQISSTFPDVLGTKDMPSSLTGMAHSGVQSAGNSLGSMVLLVDQLLSTQSMASNYSNQIITETNKTSENIFQSLLLVNDIIKSVPFSSNIQYAEIIVYGVILSLVSLLLLSQLCFVKWDKMWCRHCIYILGFLLFFCVLATFAFWLILGFLTPIAYSGCNYLGESISDPSSFANFFQRIGSGPVTASKMSVCLKGQNGSLITSLNGASVGSYLTNFSSTMLSLTSFNDKSIINSIDTSYSPLRPQLLAYSSSQVLDITDQTAINDLKYVSDSSNYISCSRGNFKSDSWIPNTEMTSNTIPCMLPSPQLTANNSTCPNSFSFIAQSSGCVGCLNTNSILHNQNSKSEAFSYLSARYTDCSRFNSDLANIWSNFYLVKKNTLAPVLIRQSLASQSVQSVNQDFTNNVGPLVSSTVNTLYSSSSSILNPELGLLGGLNCGVIGQDIQIFKQSVCANTFSYSYFHRLLMMVISLCLGVLLCCNTCVLFRKKKDILNSINFPDSDDGDGKAKAEKPSSPRKLKRQRRQRNPYQYANPPTDNRLRNPSGY